MLSLASRLAIVYLSLNFNALFLGITFDFTTTATTVTLDGIHKFNSLALPCYLVAVTILTRKIAVNFTLNPKERRKTPQQPYLM